MQKLKKLPKLCNDRGRAYSSHKGVRHYLGVHGTPDAERNYKKFIRDIITHELTGEPLLTKTKNEPVVRLGKILVSELCAAFVKHHMPRLCKTHIVHFNCAIPFVVELYGSMRADDITPKKMRDVREQMVASGRFSRRTVNDYTTMLIRIFVWGADEEMVDQSVAGALKLIKHLPKGEPGTFDNPKRRNVADEIIRRTLRFLSATVAAMVRLQRLLGLRPGEVYNMRAGDIIRDTPDPRLWYYVPGYYEEQQKEQQRVYHTGHRKVQHKRQHDYEAVDEMKIIPLGLPEQEILAPFLEGKRPEQAVFSPKTESKSDKAGEFYNKNSYRTAVQRAVNRANRSLSEGDKPIPMWSPYQLRHQAATALDKIRGSAEASAQLDHASMSTTKIYIHERLETRKELALNRIDPFADESAGLTDTVKNV